MASFNKVILMGNLTRDIELKYTPSGLAIARLGLAMNRKFRDSKTNELREEATFVDVDAFGKTAETLAQYLSKGKSVMIEGRLKTDSWDDKQTGKKVYKLKVVCDNFQFVGSPGQGQGGAAPAGGAPRAASAPRPLPPRPAPTHSAPPSYEGGEQGGPDFDQGPPAEDLNIPEENIPF
jgi:single-strand DNA-binding protein